MYNKGSPWITKGSHFIPLNVFGELEQLVGGNDADIKCKFLVVHAVFLQKERTAGV